jgi:hypothetical protein
MPIFIALNLPELCMGAAILGNPRRDFFGIVSPRPMKVWGALTKMCITAMSSRLSPSLDTDSLSALAQHLVKG